MSGRSASGGTALVVGATGVVGWNLLTRLSGRAEWRTIGLARNVPADGPADLFIPADLLDRSALEARAEALRPVTHVYLATRLPAHDPASEAEANLAALRNLMDVLEPVASGLKHVCLVHGTKWYGSHLGPYRIPAREEHTRHMPPNYYHAQHDFIRERRNGKSWTWSTLRPHTVWGRTRTTGNSLVSAIGVYAAISRELGLPLRFPGPPATYTKISQGVAADLLAHALEWVSTRDECADCDFNITNGDVFRWEDLWPKIANLFRMEVGPPQQIRLADMMADKAPVWDGIVRAHGLRSVPVAQIANWAYLDGLLAATWDDVSHTGRARHYGFDAFADSEEAFLDILASLRDDRFLP